ncbi:MAG TPA: hypothetical protein VJ726_12055 [Candidatus Limnocylindria bacterium]|nr:hypothetical protein [Candidatus Limnocylindria bacterium]
MSKETPNWSLLRPDLSELDLVMQKGEACPARLRIGESRITHDCTRPQGHEGQHYSFDGATGGNYEILWPINPEK